MNTSKTWTRPSMVAAVALAGMLLGFAAAPAPAEATGPKTMHWACNSNDRCGAGSKECCNDPTTNPSYTHCSTACPIPCCAQ